MAFEQIRLLGPFLLLAMSLAFLPVTIWNLLRTFQFGKLLHWSSLQDAWFGQFWSWFGPISRQNAGPTVEPLLSRARGVVLDIGPGSGQWLDLYSPKKLTNVTKIYGVEPNLEHHAALRQAIKREGLEGVYEIIGVGGEDLAKAGLQYQSIDTIITVQVLCSVPSPEPMVKELYKHLKPGGQWIVYEHVRTKFRYEFVAKWQEIVNLVWPTCFGGCSIVRPTDDYLTWAGEWSSIELQPGPDEGKYHTIPHSIGYLIK